MGKEITEKKEKKDRKDKKEKRASIDGVVKVKKDKKSKKVKGEDVADALDAELQKGDESMMDVDATVQDEAKVADAEAVEAALVPFAFPLSEEPKEVKKILKTVKKSAKTKTLRRGVKEVVKALRKSQSTGPASSDITNAVAIVIIAADISPMDVISHLPVLCEDHNIPYIYVKSRAELGEASATKRPTSVVMITKERNKKTKDIKESDAEEFEAAYDELLKLVVKASKSVKK